MALRDLVVTGKQAEYLRALRYLRSRGWTIGGSDMPGLVYVGGHELTIGQVFDWTAQERAKEATKHES